MISHAQLFHWWIDVDCGPNPPPTFHKELPVATNRPNCLLIKFRSLTAEPLLAFTANKKPSTSFLPSVRSSPAELCKLLLTSLVYWRRRGGARGATMMFMDHKQFNPFLNQLETTINKFCDDPTPPVSSELLLILHSILDIINKLIYLNSRPHVNGTRTPLFHPWLGMLVAQFQVGSLYSHSRAAFHQMAVVPFILNLSFSSA